MKNLSPAKNTLCVHNVNPTDAIEYINKFIDNNSCQYIDIDISFMNIIDSCYITTICSTKHYIKYPNGKINWHISSDMITDFNKDFDLSNISYNLNL
ncbi:hypothetical protein IJO12_05825 [bacterium]|nr:hypothetical protein [bacterium]